MSTLDLLSTFSFSTPLQLVIVGVWITSAIYSLPKFIYVHTVTVQNGQSSETICVPNRRIYSSEVFDMINFGLLYVTPLLVMTVSCHSLRYSG